MSSVQGPPAGNQPPAPSANDGRATPPPQNAQQREAERSGNDFSQALNGRATNTRPNGPRNNDQLRGDQVRGDQPRLDSREQGADGKEKILGADGKPKSDQPESLEDLLRQTHSQKPKKEGKEQQEATSTSDLDSNPRTLNTGESARPMEAQTARAAEVQGVDNKAMIDKIEKIADRIMVSNAADVKAVKVDFKDGVLPGTEVVIRKDASGKIHIEFTTTSAESMNFLSRGEQALTETLTRKLGGDIAVDIKMQGGDGDQDTGDGRAREQYVPDDDDSDDRGE